MNETAPLNHPQNATADDEIDLRELVGTLLDYKYAIVAITAAVTALGLLYSFVIATPVYETRAVVQMGYYIEDGSQKTLLKASEAASDAMLHFEMVREPGEPQTAWLEKAAQFEKTPYLELVTHAHSLELAQGQMADTLALIRENEAKLVGHQAEAQQDDLHLIQREIASLQAQIETIENALEKVRSREPALAALFSVEQQSRKEQLQTLYQEEAKVGRALDRLESFTLAAPIADRIQAKESPVEPKKKLIVAVSFVTGGMLAIFGVFFWEFARSFRRYSQERGR